MPQELLRDVLRAGDASGRARRHWSILPLSIAAHAVAVAGILISPLAAEIELPDVSSPLRVVTLTAALPPEPPGPRPPHPVTDTRKVTAPTEAPSRISDEPPPPTPAGPPGPPGGIGAQTGVYGLDTLGPTVAVLPPPPPPPPKIVRVGAGVREPKKLVHVAPEYPLLAQRARVEGTVMLEAILDERGRVQSVRVVRSQPLLDAAAIKAVEGWRYLPTLLNGVPVPVLMTITIQFRLDR